MAGVLALGVFGCADEGPPTGAPTTTPPTTGSTTTAEQAAADDIIGRYREFWDARLDANTEPVNPDDPRLQEFATGAQLDNVVTETRERRDRGLAIRRPEPSISERRVRIVSVDGDTAVLQDCAVNDGIVYRVGTGEILDDSIVTRNLSATMRRVDDEWKLAETRVLQEWEGVAGCAKSADF